MAKKGEPVPITAGEEEHTREEGVLIWRLFGNEMQFVSFAKSLEEAEGIAESLRAKYDVFVIPGVLRLPKR